METTGIVKKIDLQGRIALPVEMRREHDMMIDESVEVMDTPDGILIKPHHMCCIFCKSYTELTEVKGQIVCRPCIAEIKRIGAEVR